MISAFRVDTTEELILRGRTGDPRLGEWMKRIREVPSSVTGELIVIFGCPDDEGVRLNRGRAGAKGGPDSIRKHLFKMTPPMDLNWDKCFTICDFGNLTPGVDIVTTHSRAKALAEAVGAGGATGIFLGGGHDFASPNFQGFFGGRAKSVKKNEKLGLVNVDPHLDVRELENGRPNSGTPFREILESGILKGKDFVEFGARSNRNSRPHYEYCKKKGVKVMPLEGIREKGDSAGQMKKELARLAKDCHTLALTIDMDSCSDAEGVSAAPVLGFTAEELCQYASLAGGLTKVKYLELAEVAPSLEPTERSSRIAAEVIFSFLLGRARKLYRR